MLLILDKKEKTRREITRGQNEKELTHSLILLKGLSTFTLSCVSLSNLYVFISKSKIIKI